MPHCPLFHQVLLLPALLLAVMPAHRAFAQDSSALINEALDKQVNLDLNDALPSAMRSIEDKTSVPIKADPVIWELLPWGEQTNIQAKIQNQTLRRALGAITEKLGLTFSLGDEAVVLKPMPALRRLGRRATVQELSALDVLNSTAMPALTGVPKVQNILTAIDVKLEAIKSPFAIENRAGAEVREKVVDLPRNATMLEALEELVKQSDATWYPWGKSLVVVPKQTLVRDHLDKTITVRYGGVDVVQVLEELRKRAGVDFFIEPGAIQKIPPDFRSVKVFWENVTIGQALESLKGFTGLEYAITDKGVSITNPSPAVVQAAGGAGNDPVVAMVQLDNGMQVMIRESQVPSDVRAYLKNRADREVEALRKMMKQENFPASQPAGPATKP